MRNVKTSLALATALCGAWSVPALAQEQAGAANAASNPLDIVVTARRTTERLQDVPVAVSVINAAAIDSKGTYNPTDLVKNTPGLNVTASISQRDNLTYTIRGQGYSYGTLFPAVITYFNEIPIAHLTQGTFFDVQNIQVLRGPQGVSFGRVTDGGNVMVTAQTPKNEFGGYVGAKVGNYGLRTVNGAINLPIVEDKVLLRLAFETARRDGFTTNVYNGQKLDNVAYEGYRGGLTLRPVEGLENTTLVSYLHTHDNGTSVIFAGFNPNAVGLLPSLDKFAFLFGGGYGIDANGSVVPATAATTPLSGAAFKASMQAQLAAQNARGPRAVSLVDPSYGRRTNIYVVNTTTADLTDTIQLKNVFGYVHEKEFQASNYGASNGATVLTCEDACPGSAGLPFGNREQFSEELRLSGRALGNRLTWSLGGYMDEQRPVGPSGNSTINVAILNRVGTNYSTTKSRAVYGSAEFAVTDNLKINGGLRYTHDTVHNEQTTYLSPINGGQAALKNFLMGPFGGNLSSTVADQVVAGTFAPIPYGKCQTYGAGSVLYTTGALPCIVSDAAYNATTWQFGASYKTDAGQMFYAKMSKGYRPGGSNGSAPPGVDPSYLPEQDYSIEVGIKADFHFGESLLRTNIAAFTDRYKSIQKNVVLAGAVPVSLVRNVDDARIKGIEAEVTFIPFHGLTLGGTAAYTTTKFDPLPNPVIGNPCDPTQTTSVGFCSDSRFNSVPEFQYTLNFSYTLPLDENLGQISIGGNLYHQSSVALTDSSQINPESIEKPYTTVDLNATWANVMGQPVDLSAFVTNVTDKLYRIGANNLMQNSSVGVLGNIYGAPRMWGVSLKYRFGSDAK